MFRYFILLFSLSLIFMSCEEENTPGNPANPTNPPNYFIQDCDTAYVDMFFTGTSFFNQYDNTYFDIDGQQEWNTDFSVTPAVNKPMCHQYLDEPALIAAGWTYLDLLTNGFVPTQYGSKAELEYTAGNPDPELQIHLTEDEFSSTGIPGSGFHLNIDIENIFSQPTGIAINIIDEYSITNMVEDDFYATNISITFTNIDPIAKVFEGNIQISFSPRISIIWPDGTIEYHDYDAGTNTSFSATVSSFKFTAQ
jgi:hypothetical protein